MKKLFKSLGIAVATLVVLLAVATLALKIFFPAEKVKSILLKELSTRLKREVTLDRVSIGLIKGLQIENLSISEAPTFAKGTFVSVESLGVRIRWRPLLQKRVEVDTIILNAPKINVVRAADGKTFNFSDLIPATTPDPSQTRVADAGCRGLIPCAYAAPSEPAGPSAPAFALEVSRIEIQKGQVHFVDHSPAKMNVDLDETDLKVTDFSMVDFFAATWRANVRGLGLAAVTQGSARINLKTAIIELASAVISVGESKIEASGKVTNYSSEAPTLTLKIILDAVTPASFGSLAALPPALQWVGPATGGMELHGTLQNLEVGGDLKLDTVQLRYGTVFSKPAKTPLSFSFNGSILKQSTADIRTWGLKLGTLSATGHARVDGLAQKLPTISLHLTTNEFSTTDLLSLLPGALPPGTKVQGPAQVSADITGTPASNHIVAKVSGNDLVIVSSGTFRKPAGMPLEAVFKGESVENGQRLTIEALTLGVGRLQLVLSGLYETQGKDARLALALKSNDFPLDELARLSPAAAGYQLSGPGHLDMKITDLMSAPAVDGTLTLRQAGLKSTQEKVQGIDAHLHFMTPNALAPTARLALKTDGQFTAQHVHHDYYEGSALKLVWNLTDVTEDLSKVSGTAQFTQGPGALRNLDKLAQQSKTARIFLTPIQTLQKLQAKGVLKEIGLPSLDNVTFNSIQGDYVFRTGTMDIRTFALSDRDVSVTTTGTIGLAGTQPINLHNQVVLAAGSVGGTLGELLQDDQGRPTVKFTATGSVDNPKVIVDLKEAGQKAVKQLGDAIFKGVSGNDPNKALEDIGNNLKNLFKH